MTEQAARFEVIDSDGHVIEPDPVWSEYAEPEWREILAVPGGGYVQATGIKRAYPDMPAEFIDGTGEDPDWEDVAERTEWDEESKHKMSRPGGYDPVARLADMDAEGIDVAVLYPTAMLTWIEEADIFGAACRAYNNWLHDYCSAAPDRLYPVALVPLQDPDAAIAEMRRAVSELGAKAVMIRPASYIGELKLNHPEYDRFWAAAAELDCPIGVHPSPHGDMPNSCRLLGLADGVDEPDRGSRVAPGPHERVRPPGGGRLLRARRHLRTAPTAAGRIPRGHRRLDRPHAPTLRPPVRDLRQLRPVDVAQ